MKPLRYAFTLCAVAAFVVTLAYAGAGLCRKSAGAASAASGTCPHANGASAAANGGCPNASGTSATAAVAKSGACPASGQCPMSAAQCQAMISSGSCTAAMRAQCARGAAGATAVAASAPGRCARGASMAHITCGAHSAASGCPAVEGATAVECAVCSDEAACDAEVRAAGARSQLVSLRNGVMFVYTADNPTSIRALQTAVARHNARVLAALEGQGDVKLCRDCKQLRGAMASGKFVREVVNVERGCQVLLTSSDQAIVDRIHSMASTEVAARARD